MPLEFPVLDVLVPVGAHGHVAHVPDAWEHGVGEVLDEERRAPLPSRSRLQHRHERAALDAGAGPGRRCRAESARCRCSAPSDSGVDPAGTSARVPDQQRNANGLFVGEAAFLVEPVLAVEIPIVAGEHDDGVVKHALCARAWPGCVPGCRRRPAASRGGPESPRRSSRLPRPAAGSPSIWRRRAGLPSGGLNALARRGIARPA